MSDAPARGGDAAAVPSVGIGVPTYNRLALLRSTVALILAQDYPNIRLVISDNASADATQEFCRALAQRDPRVTYFRQPTNTGPTFNYQTVARLAVGDYYLNWADDNAMDPGYVSQCVKALEAEPSLVVACGRPVLRRGDVVTREAARMNVCDDDPRERVVHYFRTVEENVGFLGVMRRSTLESVEPAPNVLAGDWRFMSSIAFRGKIRTLDSVAVLMTEGDTSRSLRHTARVLGLAWYVGAFPITTIALGALRDIGWRSPVYAPLGRVGRLWLGLRVAWVVLHRHKISKIPRGVRRRLGALIGRRPPK